MAEAVVEVEGLAKRYGTNTVFEGVSLRVKPGESVAIVGESGVGKSTLLNCLAGLDTWDAGEVRLCGQALSALDDNARALLRRDRVGFVFQAFHVLPHLDVAQNVALPLLLQQRPDDARVAEVLRAVGLGDLGARLPQQLSGGQLQRVAIARALVHRPAPIGRRTHRQPRPPHRRAGAEPAAGADPTTRHRPGVGHPLRPRGGTHPTPAAPERQRHYRTLNRPCAPC